MNKKEETIRDGLLALEKKDTANKSEYERQINAMVSKQLSFPARIGFAVLAIAGLLAALPFAEMSFSRVGPDLEFIVRVVTIPGLVLALTWAVVTGWIAARGQFNLRTLPPRMAGIGIVLGFFSIVLFLFVFIVPITLHKPTDASSIFGIQLSLIAFFFLVTIGLCVLLRILYRMQFQVREKLLEIEFRIAGLAEKIEGES
jgi:hypothetical protein